jgi:HD superfamily phosphodiesterase
MGPRAQAQAYRNGKTRHDASSFNRIVENGLEKAAAFRGMRQSIFQRMPVRVKKLR